MPPANHLPTTHDKAIEQVLVLSASLRDNNPSQ
jgi:hypothetical protein